MPPENLLTQKNNSNSEQNHSSLFENPLRKEFLTFDQVTEFFGYSKQWVRQQMANGNLPYRTYGRDGVLFYIPEVRQAILDGSLAPIRRQVQNDKREKKKEWKNIRSSRGGEGFSSIQDLRKFQTS